MAEQNQNTNQQKELRLQHLITGSLIGAIVGAITSLLFAPKTGRELRADLSKQMVNTKDNTVDITKRFGTTAKGKLTNMKESAIEKSSKHSMKQNDTSTEGINETSASTSEPTETIESDKQTVKAK
ncbi:MULTISPECIES: YtxH domain-containing protein [Virgibacillus]|uniref:YtxH domain-containing protein n=1 Tax=Virgibacillus kapii TaxID=1638645 RepID=A0ABQ2DBC8_9BACI|nr:MULTISPECIES: YtxH domain-containing protein [Virgibacillus]EQB38165.1 hypothetical protein M948_06205 [Virgibacillus sp. CM-4]MYL40871.1 hypothetical protein [Virgibacillus massiliensis]GGJ52454.1 hypothetical protein GCM10007111_13260 [Virgibacillus kapii]